MQRSQFPMMGKTFHGDRIQRHPSTVGLFAAGQTLMAQLGGGGSQTLWGYQLARSAVSGKHMGLSAPRPFKCPVSVCTETEEVSPRGIETSVLLL